MNELKLGKTLVGDNHPVYIIAELSCNHRGDKQIALDTIKAMHQSGADCVKLQTTSPDRITIDCNKEPFVLKGGTIWDGRTLFDLYSETQTPYEWHRELKDLANSLGMDFFSSPFSKYDVDFLDDLGVEFYKVAGFEIMDIPLIEHIAKKGKPIIFSTGLATKEDIELAIETCKLVGNNQYIFLKCTSAYPTNWNQVDLNLIPKLKEDFNCIIGLSDHSLGHLIPVTSVAMGARIIEKHFILNKKLGGPDVEFSMDPIEFKEMVIQVRRTELALGHNNYKIDKEVANSRKFARSLFVVKDVRKGDVISEENVRSIRPGTGIHPKYLKSLLGKVFNRDIEFGTAMELDFI
jgi:pseudaminic acid synthase